MYPEIETKRTQAPENGRTARVLVVGAGALGCAAVRTLAQDRSVAVILVDDDRVELSNLQRQVLYSDDDIGRLKVEAAASRLALDFDAAVETLPIRLDAVSGPDLVGKADLVIDATDDPATKFLIGRLCASAGIPSVYGGVARTGGQWMLVVPGQSACLECVFPPAVSPNAARTGQDDESTDVSPGETAEGCAALGILAPVAGVVGAMQALKALTFLHRPERAAAGRLHVYQLTGARARHIDFSPDASCFCNAARAQSDHTRRQAS